MDIFDKADVVLQHCEHELREIGVHALKTGNYDAARRIMKLAEVLADSRTLNLHKLAATTSHQAFPDQLATPTASKDSRAGQPLKTPVRPRHTTDYPQFRRRGEKLVKVGWSKKNKQEYEHLAPETVVFAFAAHLRDHIRSGSIFSIESILPVLDPSGSGDLPTYQIYLALAWLRSVGLVKKHGRDGYVTDRKVLSDKILTQHWAALSSEDI